MNPDEPETAEKFNEFLQSKTNDNNEEIEDQQASANLLLINYPIKGGDANTTRAITKNGTRFELKYRHNDSDLQQLMIEVVTLLITLAIVGSVFMRGLEEEDFLYFVLDVPITGLVIVLINLIIKTQKIEIISEQKEVLGIIKRGFYSDKKKEILGNLFRNKLWILKDSQGERKYTLDLLGKKAILTRDKEKIYLEINKTKQSRILLTDRNSKERITLKVTKEKQGKEKKGNLVYEFLCNKHHYYLEMIFLMVALLGTRPDNQILEKSEEVIIENIEHSYNEEEKLINKTKKNKLVKKMFYNILKLTLSSFFLLLLLFIIHNITKFTSYSLEGIVISVLFSAIFLVLLIAFGPMIHKNATEYYSLLTIKSKRKHAMAILGAGAGIFMLIVVELDYMTLISALDSKNSDSWLQEIMLITAIGVTLLWIIMDIAIYIIPLKHFYNIHWTKNDEIYLGFSIIWTIVFLFITIAIVSKITI